MTAPTTQTTLCSECAHRRHGFDTSPRPGRPSELHFDICATETITPGAVDPVSGVRELDKGTACAKINHDGACGRWQAVGRGTSPAPVFVVLTIVVVVVAFAMALAGQP